MEGPVCGNPILSDGLTHPGIHSVLRPTFGQCLQSLVKWIFFFLETEAEMKYGLSFYAKVFLEKSEFTAVIRPVME